jgi:hypothetical protein
MARAPGVIANGCRPDRRFENVSLLWWERITDWVVAPPDTPPDQRSASRGVLRQSSVDNIAVPRRFAKVTTGTLAPLGLT